MKNGSDQHSPSRAKGARSRRRGARIFDESSYCSVPTAGHRRSKATHRIGTLAENFGNSRRSLTVSILWNACSISCLLTRSLPISGLGRALSSWRSSLLYKWVCNRRAVSADCSSFFPGSFYAAFCSIAVAHFSGRRSPRYMNAGVSVSVTRCAQA